MRKDIAITLAYINLNSVVNKLLFRLKKEPHKEDGIRRQIEDLDHVRNTLRFLEADNLALNKRNTELELRCLKAEEKLKIITE